MVRAAGAMVHPEMRTRESEGGQTALNAEGEWSSIGVGRISERREVKGVLVCVWMRLLTFREGNAAQASNDGPMHRLFDVLWTRKTSRAVTSF